MSSSRAKLSLMMFLQIFIWGAWYPLIFGYLPSLGFGEWEQFAVLATFNVAALVAMFFSTQFADRNFAAEKFLAFSHLVGGAAMLALFWVRSFWPFFGLMLVHTLLYVPTISITNSIAFAHLKDPQKEFGPVRLWGTIGWIAASLPFVFLLKDWGAVDQKLRALQEQGQAVGIVEWLGIVLGTPLEGAAYRQATSFMFITAGVASFVLAAFSLLLPHTPPKPASEAGEKLAWLEAVKLLAVPFVLVLFIVTFLDATVHQIFFFWTERFLTTSPDKFGVGIPGNWAPQVMSIGQVAEIGTMAFLGYVLKRLGWRLTMVIGVLGHVIRFTVFAYFPEPLPAILVNLLHGICYAFYFATVYIFVDEFFPKDARSSAQGLFNLLILGAGPLVGNFLGGRLGSIFKVGEYIDSQGNPQPIIDFHQLFLVPAAIGLVAALILLIFFRPPAKAAPSSHPGPERTRAREDDASPTALEATMAAKRKQSTE
jgi:nucleoside transporter